MEITIEYAISTSLFGSDCRIELENKYVYGGGTTPIDSIFNALKEIYEGTNGTCNQEV